MQHSNQSVRQKGLCLACIGVWILRWACLELPWAYGALMLLAGVGGVWLLRHSRSLGVFAAMLAADAAGLAAGLQGGTFAALTHALLCSFTWTGYLMALYWRRN